MLLSPEERGEVGPLSVVSRIVIVILLLVALWYVARELV